MASDDSTDIMMMFVYQGTAVPGGGTVRYVAGSKGRQYP